MLEPTTRSHDTTPLNLFNKSYLNIDIELDWFYEPTLFDDLLLTTSTTFVDSNDSRDYLLPCPRSSTPSPNSVLISSMRHAYESSLFFGNRLDVPIILPAAPSIELEIFPGALLLVNAVCAPAPIVYYFLVRRHARAVKFSS